MKRVDPKKDSGSKNRDSRNGYGETVKGHWKYWKHWKLWKHWNYLFYHLRSIGGSLEEYSVWSKN